METGRFTSIVGAYDLLSAKLASASGCRVIHVGGYNLSAVTLGLPDVGFLTLAETVTAVSRIAASVEVPVIADGDDGYGNHLNVVRLIRELERGGIAGVHIEDQVFPKRCGHMAGKRIVPAEAMVAKIKAAADARQDQDFVIIARTDAIAVEGFERAMERAEAYQEAGADIIFVEAPETMEQVVAIPQRMSIPALFNWCHGGRSPTPPIEEVREAGYRFALFTDVLFAVAPLLQGLYAELQRTGTYGRHVEGMMSVGDFNRLIGLEEVDRLDGLYRTLS